MHANLDNPTAAKSSSTEPIDQEWFLLDSRWNDSVWHLRPTNVLEETQPRRIYWSFALPGGSLFTDDQHASLLETCRQLVAVIRGHSLNTNLPQRASTVAAYFTYLRILVRWMDRSGFTRFSNLDPLALLEFQRHLSNRPGVARPSLAPVSVQKRLYVFTYLYRFRDQIDDGLRFDPFPGRSHGQVAGIRGAVPRPWPYTPDEVVIALVERSIDLLDRGADPVLKARAVYSRAMAAATHRGLRLRACSNSATRALQEACILMPQRRAQIQSVIELAELIDMLYAACFVVISYLVGPRISEILHLQVGCVQQRGDERTPIAVIGGAIFKRQPEYHGHPHDWVAPPAAVRAIAVLESLSAEHRHQAQSSQLWLRGRNCKGAPEWQIKCPGTLAISSSDRIRRLLPRLATWLALPDHEGKPWRLTSHQGRKTFARFAALRDRSALFALAQHLGHHERAVTDQGYCSSDYRLNKEIDAQIMDQSVGAWEHMLAAPGLGGRAGIEIVAKRPRFRGARLKQDIKSYARMLVDAGLVLGVCDWGFCVYREESSACLGNAAGANPARREPSTCARCANFVVSTEHRPFWMEQVRRCESLLDDTSLPLQTLHIARERVREARSMIRGIDASPEQTKHEQPDEQ